MDEIHGPGLVAPRRWTTVITQLRLHPALRHLVPQLKAQVLVKAIDTLRIDRPTLPPQQDVHAAIAIAHACLADLLDPLVQLGLRAPLRLVGIERTIDRQGGTGTPGRCRWRRRSCQRGPDPCQEGALVCEREPIVGPHPRQPPFHGCSLPSRGAMGSKPVIEHAGNVAAVFDVENGRDKRASVAPPAQVSGGLFQYHAVVDRPAFAP